MRDSPLSELDGCWPCDHVLSCQRTLLLLVKIGVWLRLRRREVRVRVRMCGGKMLQRRSILHGKVESKQAGRQSALYLVYCKYTLLCTVHTRRVDKDSRTLWWSSFLDVSLFRETGVNHEDRSKVDKVSCSNKRNEYIVCWLLIQNRNV